MWRDEKREAAYKAEDNMLTANRRMKENVL